MRTRAKALTVAVAMVTTFAILPTLGAAAAEPLEDGSYDVAIGEQTYTVEVVEGVPEIDGADGVAFTFEFDEETERVLDEFEVDVDGVTYEVEVEDDGTVKVGEGEVDETAEEEESDADDSDESDEEAEDEDDSGDVEALAEVDEDEDEVDTAAEDDAHGQVVSTVAQCAPSGREAREAGLPNHGFFVSAAARGEGIEFDGDGEPQTADLSSQEGADAFCELVDELLATASDDGVETAESADDTEDEGGNDRGRGKGRANAPGQLKKNG